MADTIVVPWPGTDGMFVFDQFGGHPPWELELPPGLAGKQPPLILTRRGDATAFLGQRWSPGEIIMWREVAMIDIDAASVCLTPRAIAAGISGDGLQEAEVAMHDAVEMRRLWTPFALDGHPAIAIYVSGGDGSYPLCLGLGHDDKPLGWLLDFDEI
jgi:hypothetical protein